MMTDTASALPGEAASPVRPGKDVQVHPRRLSSGQVARRSRRVASVRLLLIGFTGIVLAGFAGAVVWSLSQPTVAIPQAEVDSGNVIISDPRFVGRSEDGQRVTITAQRAIRKVGDTNGPVRLDRPVLRSQDGTSATGLAGVWTPAAQRLDLDGSVVFTLDDGQVARAARAVWQPDAGPTGRAGAARVIDLDGLVEIRTPSGDVMTGAQARWHDGDRVLSLAGSVTLARASGDTAAAQAARIDSTREILQLTGSARMTLSGTTAMADRITVFQARQLVVGTGATRITGTFGTATAERFEYATGTRRLQLVGRVRGTLTP